MPEDTLFDVRGRTALVAGGAGGLGRVLAAAFAERGAHVLVADIRAREAEDVAAGLPGQGHLACALDVRDEESCAAAVARAVELGGRLDVLINSAGEFHLGPSAELSREAFTSTLAANTTGVFLMSRAAARTMATDGGGGRIITLASVSSRVTNPNYAAYATSKGALVQLTRILALEWASANITVNAIGPAMTRTPMTESYLADEKNREYARRLIPLGRLATPQDIVGAAIFLASPGGAFVTGQTFYVDGGRTLL